MFSSPGQIAFSLGPIAVHWYGLLIAAGIGCAYAYALYRAKRSPHATLLHIDKMVLWLVISGIVGARLYYVLFNLSYYGIHLIEIPQLWKGGLAIHGALLGGALAFIAYCRRAKISLLAYADCIVPGVLLAQAIGRWGNFFNNEAFGAPTNLPWKLFIPAQLRPSGYENNEYFHPTFLYESLWNLLGFVLLVLLARKKSLKPGAVFFTYFIWYSFGRFFIEGLRLDSLWLGALRAAQVASAALFIGGIFGLRWVVRRSRMTV